MKRFINFYVDNIYNMADKTTETESDSPTTSNPHENPLDDSIDPIIWADADEVSGEGRLLAWEARLLEPMDEEDLRELHAPPKRECITLENGYSMKDVEFLLNASESSGGVCRPLNKADRVWKKSGKRWEEVKKEIEKQKKQEKQKAEQSVSKKHQGPLSYRNQSISIRRAENNDQFCCLLNDALGFVYGILNQFLENIIRATESHIESPEFKQNVEAIMKRIETNIPIQNIFLQFDKRPDQEMLYTSYRLFLLAQGVCCICHDRMTRSIIEFLEKILKNYKDRVVTYNNPRLSQLYDRLIASFSNSFSTTRQGAATVSQSTCRAAGQKMIDVYRGWLNEQGISVDIPLPVYTATRFDGKCFLASIGGADVAQLPEAEQRACDIIRASIYVMSDAVGDLVKGEGLTCVGVTTIDASKGGSMNDRVLFETLNYELSKEAKSKSSLKSSSSSPPLKELVVKCCVWDKRKDQGSRKVMKSNLRLRPLSYGAASLVCVSSYNLDSIDDDFMEKLQKNHTSDFFKPYVLMYQPTESLNLENKKCYDAAEKFKRDVDRFQRENDAFIRSEAVRLHLTGVYQQPPIEHDVMIHGRPHRLVSVSLGSVSNNDTGGELSKMVSGMGASQRGAGFSARTKENFVYLGKGFGIGQKPSGKDEFATLREIAVSILLFLKQFGDDSKIDALNKVTSVMGTDTTGTLASVDCMAVTTACAFGHMPCILVSPTNITVYGSSSNLKIPDELKKDISELQARIATFMKMNPDIPTTTDLHEKLKAQAILDLKKISQYMIEPNVNEMFETLSEENCENLPSILSGLLFLDYLDRDDFLTNPATFHKILTEPFNRAVHGPITGLDELAELFANAERLKQFLGCVDLLQSSYSKKYWKIPGYTNPTPNFVEKLKSVVAEHRKDVVGVNIEEIKSMVKSTIESETDPWLLFLQRKNFDNAVPKSNLSTRSSAVAQDIDYGEFKKTVVDPKCKALLELHITSNTRKGTRWRTMCNEALNKVFVPGLAVLADGQGVAVLADPIGLHESAGRADGVEGNIVLPGRIPVCVDSEGASVARGHEPRREINPLKRYRHRPQNERYLAQELENTGRRGARSTASANPVQYMTLTQTQNLGGLNTAKGARGKSNAAMKVQNAVAYESARPHSKNKSSIKIKVGVNKEPPNYMKLTESYKAKLESNAKPKGTTPPPTKKKNDSKKAKPKSPPPPPTKKKNDSKKAKPKSPPPHPTKKKKENKKEKESKKGGRQTRKRSKNQNRQLTRKYRSKS